MKEVKILDDAALDLLFRQARTHRTWQDLPVSDAVLQSVYELAKFGPTASNAQVMRVAFIKSGAAKEKLKPCLDAGNIERALSAPVIAIISYDAANPDRASDYLLRNGSLGGAYMIMAARSLGLDCLPMSGFDNAAMDAAFFAGTAWRSNFLLALGHGDAGTLQPRKPRLGFDDACKIL